MYYEEKVIGGMLFWRSTPDGDWIPMSAQKLTSMLINERELRKAIQNKEPACPLPMTK